MKAKDLKKNLFETKIFLTCKSRHKTGKNKQTKKILDFWLHDTIAWHIINYTSSVKLFLN